MLNENYDNDCEKSCRERILINMSPEGLADCLQNELESIEKEMNFLNKKSNLIKVSIKRLRQP